MSWPRAGLGPRGASCRRPRTSTASSAATLAVGPFLPKHRLGSAGSLRGEAPSRPARGRTRPGSESSATGRAAGRCGSYGEHPRLHPVYGGEPGRAPLGDGLGQRAAHPDGGCAGCLRGAAPRGGARRVCRARMRATAAARRPLRPRQGSKAEEGPELGARPFRLPVFTQRRGIGILGNSPRTFRERVHRGDASGKVLPHHTSI
jgi:hypothetical protein